VIRRDVTSWILPIASLAAFTFGPGISVMILGFLGSPSRKSDFGGIEDDGSLKVSEDATAKVRRKV
jgi:hypothetical protein